MSATAIFVDMSGLPLRNATVPPRQHLLTVRHCDRCGTSNWHPEARSCVHSNCPLRPCSGQALREAVDAAGEAVSQ